MPKEPEDDAKIRKSVSFMVTISESIPQLLMSCLVLRSYGMSVAFVTKVFQILSIVTSSIGPCFAFALVSFYYCLNELTFSSNSRFIELESF